MKIFNIIGKGLCILITVIIFYLHFIIHKEPSNFEIYVSILMYLAFFRD
jgi:hypothetical protein